MSVRKWQMIEGYLKSLLLIGLSCTIINDGGDQSKNSAAEEC
jgi:hypothetical protein